MESNEPNESRLRAIKSRMVLRRVFRRVLASRRLQKQQFETQLLQLFCGLTTASTTPLSSHADGTCQSLVIIRRPGIEEVKHCMLSSYQMFFLPPSCAFLRGELWQVLLHVSKRNASLGSSEFDQMVLRLSKLPKDPLLSWECAEMARSLVDATHGTEQAEQLQKDMELLLLWFLSTKSIEYSRGMARAVAPFFLLNLPLPTIYDCFYQYCSLFLPDFMTAGRRDSGASNSNHDREDHESPVSSESFHSSNDQNTQLSSSAMHSRAHRLQKQLCEQLLGYHDPLLAYFLAQWAPEWSSHGELIPTDFFECNIYRLMAPRCFVHVMDQYLFTNDNMFGLFLMLAVLMRHRQQLMALSNALEVKNALRNVAAICFDKESEVQVLCQVASRLWNQTPRSYKCSQLSHAEACCGSRKVANLAFAAALDHADQPKPGTKDHVDMTKWQRRESRSSSGKAFWYNTLTGNTQWEHPEDKYRLPPCPFALPISVEEVASQVCGERARLTSDQHHEMHFFVVDCRALRSSEDLKCGRIPAGYMLDPSTFDNPDMIDKSLEAFNAIKNRVHVVLVGEGIAMPIEFVKNETIKTTVRDAVRVDVAAVNQAALFFQKRGFRFVSHVDGGFSSWHAYMRDTQHVSPQELIGHEDDTCQYCRYDVMLATGEDPWKRKEDIKSRLRRKKPGMPTTTDMVVNGGEGDASIVSTNAQMHDHVDQQGPPTSASSSARSSFSHNLPGSMGRSFSMTRNSMTKLRENVGTKLLEVKMPKLSWRSSLKLRRSGTNDSVNSVDSAEASSSMVESEKSIEAEGEASTTSAVETAQETDAPTKLETVAEPPKKEFVAVFTIDDEDDDEDEAPGYLPDTLPGADLRLKKDPSANGSSGTVAASFTSSSVSVPSTQTA